MRRRRRSVGRARGDERDERVIHLCVRFFYAIHVVTLYSRDSVPSSAARLGAQYGVNLFPSSVAARRRNSRQNVTAVAFEMTAHSAMISSRLSSRSFASRATTARVSRLYLYELPHGVTQSGHEDLLEVRNHVYRHAA